MRSMMQSPEEIIGQDLVLALRFAGYDITPSQQNAALLDLGDDDFEVLWKTYPNKTAKLAARKSYRAARKAGVTHVDLVAYVARYVAEKPVDRPWLHLATFITGRRWNDAPARVEKIMRGADLFFNSAMEDLNADEQPRDRFGEGHHRPSVERLPVGAISDHSGNR